MREIVGQILLVNGMNLWMMIDSLHRCAEIRIRGGLIEEI